MARFVSFTPQQVAKLESNPYTHTVSVYGISFTLAFKKFFVEQSQLPGMTSRKILSAAGYDPKIFSDNQVHGFRKRIMAEANSPEGLHEPHRLTNEEKLARFEAKDLSKQKTDASIEELQKRLVHLEKQLEFLKKTEAIRKQYLEKDET